MQDGYLTSKEKIVDLEPELKGDVYEETKNSYWLQKMGVWLRKW
jgi:hypothetical protein